MNTASKPHGLHLMAMILSPSGACVEALESCAAGNFEDLTFDIVIKKNLKKLKKTKGTDTILVLLGLPVDTICLFTSFCC